MSDNEKKYDVREVRIATAGVFRCCLASIIGQHTKSSLIPLGTEYACEYCHRNFRLEKKSNVVVWFPVEESK